MKQTNEKKNEQQQTNQPRSSVALIKTSFWAYFNGYKCVYLAVIQSTYVNDYFLKPCEIVDVAFVYSITPKKKIHTNRST